MKVFAILLVLLLLVSGCLAPIQREIAELQQEEIMANLDMIQLQHEQIVMLERYVTKVDSMVLEALERLSARICSLEAQQARISLLSLRVAMSRPSYENWDPLKGMIDSGDVDDLPLYPGKMFGR